MTRYFVTGAAGQLGQDLVPVLNSDSADEVVAVDLADFDLADRRATLDAVSAARPDVVIHPAAFTAVDRCEEEVELAYRVNALGSRHVAEAARQVDAHVLYVSTDYVFDGTKTSPYVEWDAPNPQSVYGSTKLAGEMEQHPGSTIVRISWFCGEHGPNMVKTILRLAAEHDQLSFVDDQIGHPTFAADLAPMLKLLASERLPGIFHVTNQGAVSWHQFAQAVLEAAGADPERVAPISTGQLKPPRPAARPANSVLDNMALRLSGIDLLPDFREPLERLVTRLSAESG